MFGVDSHAASLAVCGVDQAGRRTCADEYPNSAQAHVELLEWARQHAPVARRFGIEGAGGYAHAFAQFLLAAGEVVVEVPASLTRRERRYGRAAGKSDAGDALAIARVTLREERLPVLRQAGPTRDLKLLYDYRRQLTAERTRVANRLHADLGALAPGYRDRARHLTTGPALAIAGRIVRGDGRMQADLARRRLRKLRELDREIRTLERELRDLVDASGSGLVDLCGIGHLNAARILGEVGDIRRFANRDAFASANGTAPIPASSGQTIRYRLNRGGNRRLNYAIHIMALTQMRADPRARDYAARKRAEGKTTRGDAQPQTTPFRRHLPPAVLGRHRRSREHQRYGMRLRQRGSDVSISTGAGTWRGAVRNRRISTITNPNPA
ncbi:MAG TPA: IS110 family transposase [Polyangiaceae bacterium]|nr:IS110 family transposase [Polyangiaceae bacterium]